MFQRRRIGLGIFAVVIGSALSATPMKAHATDKAEIDKTEIDFSETDKAVVTIEFDSSVATPSWIPTGSPNRMLREILGGGSGGNVRQFIVPDKDAKQAEPGENNAPVWRVRTESMFATGPSKRTGFRIDQPDRILTVTTQAIRDSQSIVVVGWDGSKTNARTIAFDDDSGLTLLQLENNPDQPIEQQKTATISLGKTSPTSGQSITLLHPWRTQTNVRLRGSVASDATFDPSVGEEVVLLDVTVAPRSIGAPCIDDDGTVVSMIVDTDVDDWMSRRGLGLTPSVMQRLVQYVKEGGTGMLPKARLGLAFEGDDKPVVVKMVVPDGPAASAGLEAGDRIVSIDELTIESGSALRALLSGKIPGESIRIIVERDGKTGSREVTLGEQQSASPKVSVVRPPATKSPIILRFNPDQLTKEQAKKWRTGEIPMDALVPAMSQVIGVPPNVDQRLNKLLEQVEATMKKTADLTEELRQTIDQKK